MDFNIKKICCIGAGFVGGPTMAVIADNCEEIIVTVVDINKQKISDWNNSDLKLLPVYEPGLEEIIDRRRNKNLFFSSKVEQAISEADMIFISVNTPTKTKGVGAGKALDLKWIEASARQVAKYAKGHTIVVEKSTLPVKTAESIKKILEAASFNDEEKQFYVISNPEFLAEGTAISDLQNPDRILIGGENKKAVNKLADIYLKWNREEKIIRTNLWSSELSKLTANAFLAQRISSINSISALCEATGADIGEVSLAIGLDQRIGSRFLNAGPGFGGSCFQKDILNLVYLCNFYNLREVAEYWEKVIDINSWQKERISKIVVEKLFGTLTNKKIGILGFSFKANTNDTREAPAIQICRNLLEEGAKLLIFDPKVKPKQIKQDLINTNENDENIQVCTSIYEISKGVDAIIIITEWKEFKDIDWSLMKKNMRSPSWVFDTRDIVDDKEIKSCGINLWKLGSY